MLFAPQHTVQRLVLLLLPISAVATLLGVLVRLLTHSTTTIRNPVVVLPSPLRKQSLFSFFFSYPSALLSSPTFVSLASEYIASTSFLSGTKAFVRIPQPATLPSPPTPPPTVLLSTDRALLLRTDSPQKAPTAYLESPIPAASFVRSPINRSWPQLAVPHLQVCAHSSCSSLRLRRRFAQPLHAFRPQGDSASLHHKSHTQDTNFQPWPTLSKYHCR